MYKTEREILSQYEALRKTHEYVMGRTEEIKSFIAQRPFKSITFIGCGSSYSLCKSAELSYKARTGFPANSIAAGDLLVNFSGYKKLIEETLLVAPSRSGSTSEVVLAVKKAVEELGVPCISISAKEKSELGSIAHMSLEIPWAFDESVCQTRTVTNLYMANLLLIGIITGDGLLVEELGTTAVSGESYMQRNRELLKEIAGGRWEKAVVLADSEIQGIAEEGALAFNEICQLPSNYYHMLDVRHGPMVLVNNRTLVIVACSPDGKPYQKDLIRDIKARGAVVVTVSSDADNIWGSDYNIAIEDYKSFAARGIPFILVPQLLSFFKAINNDVNPDVPQGLDPWIKL